MKQKEFAKQCLERIKTIPDVVGLALGGSWISDEMDEYSDLDLVLVTRLKLSDDKSKMKEFASKMGELISAFT